MTLTEVKIPCVKCEGLGFKVCTDCDGDGFIIVKPKENKIAQRVDTPLLNISHKQECVTCGGDGKLTCLICDGSGELTKKVASD